MLARKSCWVFGLCFLLGSLLLIPVTGAAKDKPTEFAAKMIKSLNLSKEQAHWVNEFTKEFSKEQKQLYGQLNQAMAELKTELAAKQVNLRKMSESIVGIMAIKEMLTSNYSKWWHRVLKPLTIEQRAQFLLEMHKWWQHKMAGPVKGETPAPAKK
ncbi:MAG: hypothetical protein P8168_15300 [Deltaproteobacteria bacterium]|jgi:hypothetical protein